MIALGGGGGVTNVVGDGVTNQMRLVEEGKGEKNNRRCAGEGRDTSCIAEESRLVEVTNSLHISRLASSLVRASASSSNAVSSGRRFGPGREQFICSRGALPTIPYE
jgi:hypothetical protein